MSLREADCKHWIYMPSSDEDCGHWFFVEESDTDADLSVAPAN